MKYFEKLVCKIEKVISFIPNALTGYFYMDYNNLGRVIGGVFQEKLWSRGHQHKWPAMPKSIFFARAQSRKRGRSVAFMTLPLLRRLLTQWTWVKLMIRSGRWAQLYPCVINKVYRSTIRALDSLSKDDTMISYRVCA